MKKIVLKVLIITFVISAMLGIFVVLSGIWNNVTEKVLLSTAAIFCFGLPGLICSACYDKIESKQIPIIGMTTCIASCIYLLFLIWFFLAADVSDFVWQAVWACITMSASFGHVSLLLLIDSDNKMVNYLKNGTCILTFIMDALLLLDIYSNIEISWRLIVTIGILIVLGTIVTPLLNKLKSS